MVIENIVKNATKTVTYTVNYLFHPTLLPTYLFIILLFSSSMMIDNNIDVKLSILKMVGFTTILTPLISVGVSTIVTRLMGEQNVQTFTSILCTSILVVSYMLAIFILKDYITLSLSLRLFVAPIIIIIQYYALRIVNYKFSLWTAAIGSVITFLYIFSLHNVGGVQRWLVVAIMVGGLIGSSRIYIEKNTLQEVGLGYLIGICATILSFYFIPFR